MNMIYMGPNIKTGKYIPGTCQEPISFTVLDLKVITLCGISIAVNFFKKGNLTLLAI